MANKTNTKHGALGFETLKDVSQVVGKQFNGTADNVFEQIFGGSFGSNPGQERAPQQEQPVSEKGLIFQMSSEAKGKPKQAEKKDFTPGINYMKELQEQTISKQEAQKISEQVDQIMVELQRLINSAPGVLQAQFADIAVGQRPAEVGKYHLTFLEWLLVTIRTARERVEDSDKWITAVKGKNGKKDWERKSQKGKNTMETQHHDRTAATQTG